MYSTNSDETAVAVYGLFAMGKEIFISIRRIRVTAVLVEMDVAC
jgi:hypothetical protein